MTEDYDTNTQDTTLQIEIISILYSNIIFWAWRSSELSSCRPGRSSCCPGDSRSCYRAGPPASQGSEPSWSPRGRGCAGWSPGPLPPPPRYSGISPERKQKWRGERWDWLTLVRIPVPPQQVSTQGESERETRPQQQGRTQPKSLVLVWRQQAARQRLARLDTFPTTFSVPAGWDMKPSLAGLWPSTQSQLCSWGVKLSASPLSPLSSQWEKWSIIAQSDLAHWVILRLHWGPEWQPRTGGWSSAEHHHRNYKIITHNSFLLTSVIWPPQLTSLDEGFKNLDRNIFRI